MKKLIAFSLVLLLFCTTLVGCGETNTGEQGDNTMLMTEEMGKEIIDAWYNERVKTNPDYIRPNKLPFFFYGIYDEYVILFQVGGFSEAEVEQKIDDVSFKNYSQFKIFGYKDGVFSDIKELYDNDLLSKNSVSQIALIHSKSKVPYKLSLGNSDYFHEGSDSFLLLITSQTDLENLSRENNLGIDTAYNEAFFEDRVLILFYYRSSISNRMGVELRALNDTLTINLKYDVTTGNIGWTVIVDYPYIFEVEKEYIENIRHVQVKDISNNFEINVE